MTTQISARHYYSILYIHIADPPIGTHFHHLHGFRTPPTPLTNHHTVPQLFGNCGHVDRKDEVIYLDDKESSIICTQYSEYEFDSNAVPGICSRMTHEQREKEKEKQKRKIE